MTDRLDFETRLEERMRARAALASRPFDAAAIAHVAAAAGKRRRGWIGGFGLPPYRPAVGWLIVAMILAIAVLGAVAGIGALLLLQRDPIQDLSLEPPTYQDSATPAPSAAPSPAAASTGPSPTAAPLAWTQASLEKDWPAPVRSEPAGSAIVLPILHKTVVEGTNCPGDCGYTSTFGDYVDPTGDTGSAVFPWVDIRGVRFCGTACLTTDLVTHDRPVVDPVEQWMAYGVVFDTDRDGVADWRYGVDNLPIDPSGWAGNPDSERMARDELANGAAPHRAWRTDLHTGRTESAAGPPYGGVGETRFDTFWTRWSFGGDSPGGHVGMPFDVPFYVWASEIKDGRVVATDYAPDVGWLLPSPDAKP